MSKHRHSCRLERPLCSFALPTLLIALAVSPVSLPAADKPEGVLSDDGDVVMVAKVPDALKLADFGNHLGIVPANTRVRILETRRDPAIPTGWTKVEILEGAYKGQSGWALSQTVHVRKQPRAAAETSDQKSRRLGRVAPEPEPKIEDVLVPPRATHRVIKGIGLWTEPSALTAAGQQLKSGDFVEKTELPREDAVTSFLWINVRVLSGVQANQTGWIPSHALKELVPPHQALLVIFGGFFDKSWTENVKSWAKELSYPNTVVRYFAHDAENRAVRVILEHLRENMSGPVIIVGHSWGGDTAMDAANALNKVGPGVKIELAVTLDAVSWGDMQQNFGGLKTKNIQKWINVWNKGTGVTDLVATLGGHWGDETGAENVKLERDQNFTHADSERMFQVATVQTALKQALANRIERSAEEQAAIKGEVPSDKTLPAKP